MSPRRLSVLLVLASAIGFSFNGLIVRLLEGATPPQAVFYRSAFMTSALLGVYLVVYRRTAVRHVVAVGWLGLAAAALLAGAMVMSFTAMYHATIANVVFVGSAIPFFTAALAFILLGERVPRATLGFMGLAFCGMSIMVGGGISVGAALGNFLALQSALLFSLFVVIVRRRQDTDMTPVIAIAGLLALAYCGVASGGDLNLSWHDIAWCALWGGVIAGLGHSLFVIAARGLAGAEVTFVMLLEFVLAPIWVWLVVGEIPTWTTVVGGGVVMISLALWTLRVGTRS